MGNCSQCKYGEKWDNGKYHCLKEIGDENSSLHSGDWFCADFEETKEEIYYGIDLSTKEEIELRFNQICACFAILVRDKTEPQSVYTELYCIASALKEKFCKD